MNTDELFAAAMAARRAANEAIEEERKCLPEYDALTATDEHRERLDQLARMEAALNY